MLFHILLFVSNVSLQFGMFRCFYYLKLLIVGLDGGKGVLPAIHQYMLYLQFKKKHKLLKN